ncbi:MAG: hypothetical protein A2V83_03860 [Nitrospirae bacterium RBG_16_64_22]|nr:MAG: hypothetical protein A2V83_03860 [Nitrospirae bacterium RBG_16_64_22]
MPPPLVSVVIPARNEEENIGPCVESLRKSAGCAIEIIVVDDESGDRTAEIVQAVQEKDSRVRLVRLNGLEPGWVGKSHALFRGVREARGEWLLFTDADTRHRPRALAECLALAGERNADLVSLSPEQVCGSFWERLLQPEIFSFLESRFPFHEINGDIASCAAANGQYLLIRRSVLEDVGGMEAVRSEIVEDLALARLVKEKGFRIHFSPGEGRVEARMYRSFRSLWQGWSKNLFALSGGQVARLVRLTGVRLLLDIAPAGAGLAALAGALSSPSLGTLVLATASVVFYGGRSFYLKDVWARPCAGRGYALLHPLAAVLFLGLLWYSAYLSRWVGTIGWRGRSYRVGAVDV